MKKSFVTVTPDNGSNNGALFVVCDQNEDSDAREINVSITGEGITKSLNISQNGVSKIDMIEIGGHAFDINSAIRYSTDYTDNLISIHCILSAKNIHLGTTIENITVYGVTPFDINWSSVTDCGVQCLTAGVEDFITTIYANGTNIYYNNSDWNGIIEAIMDYSETSYCNANIATAVMNGRGTVEIIFNAPGKGFKVTIQIVA